MEQKTFNGENDELFKYLGAHREKNGYYFRVFAPNALKIELIGDFNNWNGKNHRMQKIHPKGFYEIFIDNY